MTTSTRQVGEAVIVPREPTSSMKLAGLQELPFGPSSVAHAHACYAAMLAAAPASDLDKVSRERDEAYRRRDEWRKKAEGFDAVRLALREKVGAPWPPNLSRALWAGIAADEKKRADDAEAERDEAVRLLRGFVETHEFRHGEGIDQTTPPNIKAARAFLNNMENRGG